VIIRVPIFDVARGGYKADATARLLPVTADIRPPGADSRFDPGCVKTLRGITAPEILSPVVMQRAKKRKNLPSARRYNQIRFRFHTAKTRS
jgi:hypothetical protein